MKSFALAILAATAAAELSDHWAVIMAGSNTYSNYRHQADSHHAVQIMLANGIPRDQIIHLAYDDIASNYYNPFPGQIFNVPSDGPGVNVYDQSQIDYSGSAVNKQNFFNVLLGDDSNGPALKSDSNSRVFVYFVDHGGAGLICTPGNSSDWIYADELNDTLNQMKEQGMFGELVFYLETCESGSMFPYITSDSGIYAMTASNATQSSYGAYCGSEAVVDGTSIYTCLADLFSINWMMDTEGHDISVETLATQHETVKELTSLSPVQVFGDMSFLDEPIGDFEGILEPAAMTYTQKMLGMMNDAYSQITSDHKKARELVDSREHDLHFLYNRVMHFGTQEDYAALRAELDSRQFFDDLFSKPHFDTVNAPEIPQNFDCLRSLVGTVEDLCGTWSAYSLKYVSKLAKVCDTKSGFEQAEVYEVIANHCTAQ